MKKENCRFREIDADTSELLKKVNEWLRGVNKCELASELGVSRQSINAVLRGKSKSVKVFSALYQKALEIKKNTPFNPYANVQKAIRELEK